MAKKKIVILKSGSKTGWIIASAFVLILAVGVFASYMSGFSPYSAPTGQAIADQPTGQNCREVQVPYEDIEYYTETVPYTDQECETKTLVYSITDFKVTGSCVDYDERCKKYILGICVEKEEFCVERKTTCSLNLNNLDDERGTWVIRFTLYGDGSVMEKESVSKFLYPQTSGNVQKTFTLIGEEKCNKNQYSCSYGATNEPTKQICRDVIKYKEVQKSRTVTRYRTETRCD
ncbi:MAG: hypothetical protein ACE5KE_14245 [Methanosarcinales archaeon]